MSLAWGCHLIPCLRVAVDKGSGEVGRHKRHNISVGNYVLLFNTKNVTEPPHAENDQDVKCVCVCGPTFTTMQ